jgi:hypothetical protein
MNILYTKLCKCRWNDSIKVNITLRDYEDVT